MSKAIPQALAEFDRDVVLNLVRQGLDEGQSPIELVAELQKGMSLIGDRFNTGRYFLSELIMSADLFSKAMKMIEPLLAGQTMENSGTILIGTPKGDIHDLGKDIFSKVAQGA